MAFRRFWQTICHSFEALQEGFWPGTEDELAGGFKGLIVAVTGDLEFISSGYQLQNSHSGQRGVLGVMHVSSPIIVHTHAISLSLEAQIGAANQDLSSLEQQLASQIDGSVGHVEHGVL